MSVELRRTGMEAARRLRQLRSTMQREGVFGVGRRVRGAAANWISPKEVISPVRAFDVLAADLSKPFEPAVRGPNAAGPFGLNWVTTPPALGAGGHSTTFRI